MHRLEVGGGTSNCPGIHQGGMLRPPAFGTLFITGRLRNKYLKNILQLFLHHDDNVAFIATHAATPGFNISAALMTCWAS